MHVRGRGGVAWGERRREGRVCAHARCHDMRAHDAMVCVCVCTHVCDMHGPSSVRPMRAVTAGCRGKRMLRVDAKLVVPFAEVAQLNEVHDQHDERGDDSRLRKERYGD